MRSVWYVLAVLQCWMQRVCTWAFENAILLQCTTKLRVHDLHYEVSMLATLSSHPGDERSPPFHGKCDILLSSFAVDTATKDDGSNSQQHHSPGHLLGSLDRVHGVVTDHQPA